MDWHKYGTEESTHSSSRGLERSEKNTISIKASIKAGMRTVEAEPAEYELAWLKAPKFGTSEQATVSSQLCLRVLFFGWFELICNRANVPLGNNTKARAILRYLLAHSEEPVSRDHLMAWLWPEANMERARCSLNSAIYRLRILMANVSSPTSLTDDLILFDQGHYRLSPTVLVSSDVAEFEACYKHGRTLERAGRMTEAAAEYEKALRLRRGEYLLDDLYEEWPMIERERLNNVYLEILDRLAVYYAGAEKHRECIQVCYRLLKEEPCYESSHRLIMQSYARLGLLRQVSRQYQLCQTILQRKVGSEPSLKTKVVYRDILQQ